MKGFQLLDKVNYKGKHGFIFGRRTSGYFDLRECDGTKVHASASCKQLRRVEHANTLLIESKASNSSPNYAIA